MFNIRIALSPSGKIHIGNFFIILINYLLKNKIFSSFFLRIDNTNLKKNKLLNIFFIINNLKKIGIYFNFFLKQLNFINIYKKKIFSKKKSFYKKNYFNNKIKLKNLTYSILFIINNCIIKYFDNNYGNLKFKIFFEKNIIFKKNFSPTYNYSTIIDDFYNNIFIIIRGKEWLNQIPFQILIIKQYKLFFQFNHLPNINFYNGKKISKRSNFKKLNFDLFSFLKLIKKKCISKNKDFKFLFLEKKKKIYKKINNFIILNLFFIIKKINILFLKNFFKLNFFFKKIKNLNFSNINFYLKINKDIINIKLKNKIKIIIKNIKKYEFI